MSGFDHDAWGFRMLALRPSYVRVDDNADAEDAKVVPLSHCWYCGRLGHNTRDHQIPISRGGSSRRANLVDACWPCNNRKRSRTVEEYRDKLAGGQEGDEIVFYGERQ